MAPGIIENCSATNCSATAVPGYRRRRAIPDAREPGAPGHDGARRRQAAGHHDKGLQERGGKALLAHVRGRGGVMAACCVSYSLCTLIACLPGNSIALCPASLKAAVYRAS